MTTLVKKEIAMSPQSRPVAVASRRAMSAEEMARHHAVASREADASMGMLAAALFLALTVAGVVVFWLVAR